MKRTGRQMKRSGRQVKGSGRQASREPDHKHPAWETNEKNWETHEKKWETNERKWETSQPGTRPQAPRQMKRTGRQMKRSGRQMKGSGRQASREPDHKHPAWETNEKNWETNERKWETSRPGTRPDHPAPRRPFFKALRTPNSKLFGEKATNELAPGAQISPYAFESCLALSNVNFEQMGASASVFRRHIPEGSFCGSGIEQLKLPPDFNFFGPIACENCKRLAFVDLSSTEMVAMWGSTFSHCVNLVHIWFPTQVEAHWQRSLYVLHLSSRSIYPTCFATYSPPGLLRL